MIDRFQSGTEKGGNMRVTYVSTLRFVMTHMFMLGAALLLAGICPVSAATITVTNLNDSGPGSLRQAITDAASGDTINFSVTGTIQLASQLMIAKNLTITGPGPASLTIRGADNFRVFDLETTGTSISISGLSITNGHWNGASGGGGILALGIALNLTDVNISGNVSKKGAGLLIGSNVSGGATVNISNSVIEANGYNDSAAGWGGGVYVDQGGTLYLSSSTIRTNTIGNGLGGGIFVSFQGAAHISDSSIVSNSAIPSGGGGIYVTSGTLHLTNSTVSENTGGGLGVSNAGSVATLLNSTIANNFESAPGHAANIHVFATGAVVTATNSIVANPGTPGAVNCLKVNGGAVVSNGHNLDSEDSCGFNSSGDLVNTNPLIGLLSLNAPGSTVTHALGAASPALDAADAAVCPSSDQRGVQRPQGAGCDIGAYEREVYREIHTSVTAGSGSISCIPYGFTAGTTNITYYIVDHTDAVCVMTPGLNNHVADVFIGAFPVSILLSVGPLWTYGYPNISGSRSIQASFAANHIWLRKGGLPASTVTTTINDAVSQAVIADDDEIRIESGAYFEGVGVTCSGDFGGMIPILSGGWTDESTAGTKRTVIAPKLTISGSCALEIDEITIQ